VIIGVMSDTHGDAGSIKEAVKRLASAEMWLHAGDYSQDAHRLAKLAGVPVLAVAGNCDGQVNANTDEFVPAGGKTIWVTHGHRYHVKHNLHELEWWGRQYEADIIVYGHTHVADIQWCEGRLIFNPGSAARSRWNLSPSFGVIEISSNEGITARIIQL
jgi:putative phosphoesterase